jgi:hypothetical protein
MNSTWLFSSGLDAKFMCCLQKHMQSKVLGVNQQQQQQQQLQQQATTHE